MAIYERMTLKPRAGALPEYNRQSENYVPGQGVSARVDDSAARIAGAGQEAEARALGNFGATLGRATSKMADAYDEYSRSKATALITRYRRSQHEALVGEGGLLRTQGEEALGVESRGEAVCHRLREELSHGVGEKAKHYFNLFADAADRDFSLQTARHAEEQRVAWMNRTDEDAAQERAEAAMAAYNNRDAFNRAVAESLWYTRQRLLRQGFVGEAVELGLKEMSSKIFLGALQQALANKDMGSAEALLQYGGKEFKDEGRPGATRSYMTAPDLAAARESIERKREAMAVEADRAAKQEEAQLVQGTASGFLEQARDFPEDEREGALAEMCEGIADLELRKKVFSAGRTALAMDKARSNAEASRQVRAYEEFAQKQGWNAAQAMANLPNATNLSEKAVKKLEENYSKGLNKETPENRAAKRELLVLLDKGVENGGMDSADTDAIEDYAFKHGLTTAQTKAALKYAETGGAKGFLTMSMAQAAAKQLYPKDETKAKNLAAEYFDLLADQLDPGKKATVDQVRGILAMFLTQGESEESIGFRLGRDMSYGKALKRGEGESFFATVPQEDKARIEALLRQEKIDPTPARVSQYYLQERRAGR